MGFPDPASAAVQFAVEQVPPTSPLAPYVSIDPDRLSGEPVFRGTRVPVRSLFDHLRSNISLEEFLDDFEGVPREAAEAVIELAAKGLLSSLGGAKAA